MKKIALILTTLVLAAGCSGGGKSYSGDSLARDVARTLNNTAVYDFHCDDVPHVKAGVIADCWRDSNGQRYRVTFDDDQGHFTLNESR